MKCFLGPLPPSQGRPTCTNRPRWISGEWRKGEANITSLPTRPLSSSSYTFPSIILCKQASQVGRNPPIERQQKRFSTTKETIVFLLHQSVWLISENVCTFSLMKFVPERRWRGGRAVISSPHSLKPTDQPTFFLLFLLRHFLPCQDKPSILFPPPLQLQLFPFKNRGGGGLPSSSSQARNGEG